MKFLILAVCVAAIAAKPTVDNPRINATALNATEAVVKSDNVLTIGDPKPTEASAIIERVIREVKEQILAQSQIKKDEASSRSLSDLTGEDFTNVPITTELDIDVDAISPEVSAILDRIVRDIQDEIVGSSSYISELKAQQESKNIPSTSELDIDNEELTTEEAELLDRAMREIHDEIIAETILERIASDSLSVPDLTAEKSLNITETSEPHQSEPVSTEESALIERARRDIGGEVNTESKVETGVKSSNVPITCDKDAEYDHDHHDHHDHDGHDHDHHDHENHCHYHHHQAKASTTVSSAPLKKAKRDIVAEEVTESKPEDDIVIEITSVDSDDASNESKSAATPTEILDSIARTKRDIVAEEIIVTIVKDIDATTENGSGDGTTTEDIQNDSSTILTPIYDI